MTPYFGYVRVSDKKRGKGRIPRSAKERHREIRYSLAWFPYRGRGLSEVQTAAKEAGRGVFTGMLVPREGRCPEASSSSIKLTGARAMLKTGTI